MKKKIIAVLVFDLMIFGGFTFIYADVDTTPPTGTILINSGALYTNNQNVTLTLSATDDNSGLSQMEFNNGTGSYSNPEPYSTTKMWTLSQSGDGIKTVRVKFIDQAGNETKPGIPATITLDTITPVISLIGDSTINLNVGDTYVDAGVTALDNEATDISSSIVKGGTFKDTLIAGTFTITYDVSDAAGNPATQVTRTIIVSAVTQTPPDPTSTPSENIIIRNGDSVIFSGTTPLPLAGTTNIADDTGATHAVNADSTLGVVYALSQNAGSTFSFSDLQYYSGMGFMIKCITPKDQSQLCSNWQYVVDGTAPWDSIDNKILSGGETIGIYFGYPYQVTFDKTSIDAGGSFTANAQKYNSTLGTWEILSGISIDVTVPNPSDEWSPTVITSQAVDANGIATLTLPNAGTYNISISDSFFNYYYTPIYTVIVNTPSVGGGGGTPPVTHHTVDINKALQYLASKQNSDGSFSSDLYTDWAGIALAGSSSSAKDKITNYLKNNSINSNVATDNERHAMALMALGINPYTGTEINYIKKITDSFDGTQFGDASLVNDDIFAIFPLIKAGYSASDVMIQSDSSFIISKQGSDGSWGSVDLTAAAIQALSLTSSSSATTAIAKAEQYLKNAQQTDGGFSNISSTSWALQAIHTLGEDSSTWIKNNLNPNDYLYTLQQTDGGMDSLTTDEDTRIWETSYAIAAASNKSWINIMQSFPKFVATSTSVNNIVKNSVTPTPVAEPVVVKTDLIKISETPKINEINQVSKPSIKIVKSNKVSVIEKPKIVDSIMLYNLGASAGDAISSGTSFKRIPQAIGHSVVNVLTYIGKGFYNFVSILVSPFNAIFR